jgi:hypothetical protein
MRVGLAGVVCALLGLAGCSAGSLSGGSPPAAQFPVANANGPYAGMAGATVSFSGSGSSDPQGQTLTYA